MNLRQKRKHFKYSAFNFVNKAFGFDSVAIRKFIRKYRRSNLKINKVYDYTECSYNYYILNTYEGNKPKFMRERKKKKLMKESVGDNNEW